MAASSATTSASTTAQVVWAIEYSKIQQWLIWAGTNDGKLWYTNDDGANWIDVTKNFKDLPAWGDVHADLAVDLRSRHGLHVASRFT